MSKIKKELDVIFYDSGANEPVRDWIKSDDELRMEIGTSIRTVQMGWPMGLPVCRNIEGDIWEVRIKLTNRIARVLFILDGSVMVLLHGFIKKTQATPKHEIDIAKDRMKLYRRNK